MRDHGFRSPHHGERFWVPGEPEASLMRGDSDFINHGYA